MTGIQNEDLSVHDCTAASNYIPGIYEVYRGYIVFEFSVMFVCVCVNFFSIKDFSGTA